MHAPEMLAIPDRLRRAPGSRARVLITAPSLPEPVLAELAARHADITTMPIPSPPEAVLERLHDGPVDAILSRTTRLTATAIEAAQGLKVIAKHGVGVDNIDIPAATARGIPVLVCTGSNARSVAEHALALILALARNLTRHDAALRAGEWSRFAWRAGELSGRTLGLVGFGASARALAGMVRGLELSVLAYSPGLANRAVPPEVTRCPDLATLLATSDIVSLHCPLTPATRHLIDAAALARMKPGAWLINVARGGVVDQAALVAALREGRLAAGLDSFAEEPLPPKDPLRTLENVVLTPHVAGASEQSTLRVGLHAVRNLFAVLDGEAVAAESVVNPTVLRKQGEGLRPLDPHEGQCPSNPLLK